MRALKPVVFLLCLLPFGWLVYAAGTNALGPDPAESIMHLTGEWSLRILLVTLAVSPVRKIWGWRWPMTLRRMLGLFAFFYATVHLASFGHFYIGWTPAILVEELVERPYITVGALAWVLMLPLAVTSTRKMQRRLKRNWRRLHRAVYPVAMLACLHLLWQARSDLGEPILYSVLLFMLLIWRLPVYRSRRSDVLSG
ncbi:sulfoxide reductase heme-binding subunit YedZ [Halieaceae bacterium IMCC8485]|jgi:sulfoxide reductase heme-binding subunit YedZ|uniref:Protein-methionine-sulfoxide reductase heme-binding subunit MsrQ n=1 Tax=Candidatus Seongchinamella marina TaxID=2518990 RepID=A0ABT3SYK0_9GAMM|nr:sulfoxide reductase heme-binding subunit YedZ [Candidatus Seongchinamella marina]MCX2975081.1 sulfoxide reductase heme-binding subunit YedZ [Candidatus Seongchinamella marina]